MCGFDPPERGLGGVREGVSGSTAGDRWRQ